MINLMQIPLHFYLGSLIEEHMFDLINNTFFMLPKKPMQTGLSSSLTVVWTHENRGNL